MKSDGTALSLLEVNELLTSQLKTLSLCDDVENPTLQIIRAYATILDGLFCQTISCVNRNFHFSSTISHISESLVFINRVVYNLEQSKNERQTSDSEHFVFFCIVILMYFLLL